MALAEIHFSTGTGGTALAASFCADILRASGWAVRMQPVAGEHPQAAAPGQTGDGDSGPADLELHLFPVYSFGPPAHHRALVARRGKKAVPALVLAFHGGGPGGAAEMMARLLTRRGRKVAGVRSFYTPAQWTQAGMVPRAEEVPEAFKAVREDLEEWLKRALEKVGAGSASALPPDPWAVSGPVRALGGLVNLLERGVARHFLGMLWVADRRCTSCGLCARECPVGCISLGGATLRPAWKTGCVSCGRCINICPVASVQCSWLRLGLVLVPQLACLAALVPLGLAWGIAGVGAGLGGTVLTGLAQLFLLHPALAWRERRKGAPDWLSAGWTQGVGRYLVKPSGEGSIRAPGA